MTCNPARDQGVDYDEQDRPTPGRMGPSGCKEIGFVGIACP